MPLNLNTWVYFDASSGTPTIQDDENVTSLTDNGVGDFDINFTTLYADTNWLMGSSAGGTGTSYGEDLYVHAKTTGVAHVKAGTAGGGFDMPFNHAMFIGTLV